MPINFNKAEFVLSAVNPSAFIRDGRPQVTFAGRSNVGKSSVINRLLNRKNFARVGATPGKTTQINYFLVDERLYLVDLPGYGYAKRSFEERDRWAALIGDFFQRCAATPSLACGALVIDARHGPLEADLTMADYYAAAGLNFFVVANKSDKLNKTAFADRSREIRAAFAGRADVLMYSAEKGTGRTGLLDKVDCFVRRGMAHNEEELK